MILNNIDGSYISSFFCIILDTNETIASNVREKYGSTFTHEFIDHHLTTPSSQPVPCVVFYAPTFFYNHHKQRRKLCTLHNFRRWFMVFICLSQFSDPKGRRFESCQPHQKMSLYCRTATFLFCHGSCLSIHFVTMYAAILAMTDTTKLIR